MKGNKARTHPRRLMLVTPSPALLHSQLIYDVVHSKRKLAVDLDTGVLTILSGRHLLGPEPKYVFRSGSSIVDVPLSRDWGDAKEQLLALSLDVPRGSFRHGSRCVSFSGSWRSFRDAVSQVYNKKERTRHA
jgi:hypothetical protein